MPAGWSAAWHSIENPSLGYLKKTDFIAYVRQWTHTDKYGMLAYTVRSTTSRATPSVAGLPPVFHQGLGLGVLPRRVLQLSAGYPPFDVGSGNVVERELLYSAAISENKTLRGRILPYHPSILISVYARKGTLHHLAKKTLFVLFVSLVVFVKTRYQKPVVRLNLC